LFGEAASAAAVDAGAVAFGAKQSLHTRIVACGTGRVNGSFVPVG
jgi:hypothetical protein